MQIVIENCIGKKKMDNNQLINFNGKNIKIEDILKKSNKAILIGLYIKTHDLESTTSGLCEKIEKINKANNKQWAKISKNGKSIGWLKGVLSILVLLVVGIISYLALT